MIKQMAAMPRYEVYKDSGVEWLGEIPAHWRIIKLKRILSFKTGGTPSSHVSGYYDGDEPWITIADLSGKYTSKFHTISKLGVRAANIPLVKSGSLLFSFKLSVGQVAFAHQDLYTNEAIAAFEPLQSGNLSYWYYAISQFVIRNAATNIYGAYILNQELIKNAQLLLPSLPEQTSIVAFLDRKTAQIDQAVAIKEKQIALLKECKQILIQNAVTRGLNPDVPMRDSGVEWIGEIPAHWLIVPIRRLVDVRDGTHDTPEYIQNSESSRFLITSKDFSNGKIKFENAKSISIKDHNEISKRSKVDTDDVLMSMIGGNIGKCVLVNELNEFSIKNVALFKTHGDRVLGKYILFYLASGLLEKQIQLNSRGGAQGFLSLGDVRDLIFFKIPAYEQTAIVSLIETESAKIDQAISIQQQQIDKLKEYKATLINSAVTGKIKVPELSGRMEATL